MLKTYKNWKGDLSQYLQIGDAVDQEMVDYFINVLPPRTLNGYCIQIGEPYSHEPKGATYSTLRKDGNVWRYAGHCYAGETEEPTIKYQ